MYPASSHFILSCWTFSVSSKIDVLVMEILENPQSLVINGIERMRSRAEAEDHPTRWKHEAILKRYNFNELFIVFAFEIAAESYTR
ncbi:predicted protein [Sclerotinia sclerotiorum 1980 UF-70]|uniref:Uncharacterized protein n=1 Tax=Sclerotinia sclerotiorum (strain ATCC 18683 / 1980 / Ss-1) TaxID=665079 RepID=A7F7N7_SCLS1|nr:predicted protein [Sclerotinia sclerotiorum 1980 UF-70]EDN98758.1 predicted protein [Sclerotinia sclerotiorum 1980 UF-70]